MGKKATKSPGRKTGTTGGKSTAKAAPIPASASSGASEPDTVRGRVVGYTVGRQGLIIKLDVGAVRRVAVSVRPDEPHFRPAISMAMVALNNRINPNATGDGFDQQYLWVWMEAGTEDQMIRPASVVAMSYNNDASPFDIEGFVFQLET